ncbi:16S rRNA (cytosine(967)-C(5))-methyltransferase RsmB [Geoalkalibacter sp.]|uniref:16S rRNA (cytosine(967)-C(5))-methyltransferase RsmB n=1 Tax=Geoalkalibacter sp. TaxID=3041440 RepID=UPI00272EC0FA|nr:16S rRNA (cytosine(967)-C(5))-methyltransferase RsmB [Geoalkalibacter sp.]
MSAPSPRHAAFDILRQVEDGAFADLALDAALQRALLSDPRDRALLTELVYGVLRRRGRLDFALSRCCRQPLTKLEPAVLRLLRLGAHQLLHLERIPAHAVLHETVGLARRLGLERATGLINGVLRALTRELPALPWPDATRDPRAHLEHALSLPGWLAQRLLSQFGAAQACALGAALLEPAPFTLRANRLKISRTALDERLAAAGHETRATRYAEDGLILEKRGPASLPGDEEGLYQVQDQASQLIAPLLGARPAERILDACAAPGGKTTHLAALTGDRASLLALDLHPQRVALIREGAARLGCASIEARAWDLRRTPDFVPPGSFDRILVDAPCSGLGVLRRNPEIRWRRAPRDLQELAALQGAILAAVAPLLRPGGVLLYSVCTFTNEETKEVIAAFLDAHGDFVREDLRPFAPPHWAELFDEQGALRTLPHRHDGMDAFWAVRMRKR